MFKEAGFHEYSPFTGRPMETAWLMEECYSLYDSMAWSNQISKKELSETSSFELNVEFIRRLKNNLLTNHGIHSEERYGLCESFEHCHLRVHVEFALDPMLFRALKGLHLSPETISKIPRILLCPVRDLEATLKSWAIPEERIIPWNRTLKGIKAADSQKVTQPLLTPSKTALITNLSEVRSMKVA